MNLSFTVIKVHDIAGVRNSHEIHATGCRDLKKFAGERTEILAVTAADAAQKAIETLGLGDGDLKVMPCNSLTRMRHAGRAPYALAPVAEEAAGNDLDEMNGPSTGEPDLSDTVDGINEEAFDEALAGV